MCGMYSECQTKKILRLVQFSSILWYICTLLNMFGTFQFQRGPCNSKGCIYASVLFIWMWFFFQSIVLQEQITGTSAEGGPLPTGDAAKELAQAQQMINEMRNRNFGQQLMETEKEKREAQLCKSLMATQRYWGQGKWFCIDDVRHMERTVSLFEDAQWILGAMGRLDTMVNSW